LINKKNSLIIISIIYFLNFLFLLSCKSPESPETPEIKPRAKIEISLGNAPVVMYLNSNGCWYPEWGKPKVIISETNGVGCTISTVKLELMYQGSPCWPITEEGESIGPYGSFSVIFWDFYVCYKYNKIKITAKGGDSNGYSISESAFFDLYYVD